MFFSIISAYNNRKILNDMLIKSLSNQTFNDYELILVDSKQMNFSSASSALNYGASIAKGEYLIFVHQDVEFLNNTSLYSLKKICDTYKFGIAGVAGIRKKEKKVLSSVKHGLDRTQAGIKNEEILEVDGLDECLFVIKKSDFLEFTFYGKTWHLYAPDYCAKCKRRNEKILLIPIQIYHLSPGLSMSLDYFDALYNFGKINKDIKVIYTTMGIWKNNFLLGINCLYRKEKLKLKKLLGKI